MSSDVKQPVPNSTTLPHDGDGLGFATRYIHHEFEMAKLSNAVQPPVFLTSTYGFESVAANEAAAAPGGKLHAREHNPTTEILEQRIANLEEVEAGLVLALGMAASGALSLSLLSKGDDLWQALEVL